MRYDCHVQVFDRRRWWLAGTQAVSGGTTPQLRASMVERRVAHALLVQPGACHDDHGCLLEALGQLGPAAAGVAWATGRTTADEVARWQGAGVCAARVALRDDPWACAGEVGEASRHLPSTWPMELEGTPQQLAAAAPLLARTGRVFVYALPGDAMAASTSAWSRLVWWAEMGSLYLKLVAPRPSERVAALVRRQADRLLWGSGWPQAGDEPPSEWLELAPTLDQNAQRLYWAQHRWTEPAR